MGGGTICGYYGPTGPDDLMVIGLTPHNASLHPSDRRIDVPGADKAAYSRNGGFSLDVIVDEQGFSVGPVTTLDVAIEIAKRVLGVA